MAETPEDFAVHRFVRELFEDLTLTLPSLGCAFEGTVAPNALTVHGPSQILKNKLFLLFADLASRQRCLKVKFQPSVQGPDLALGFLCTPFVGVGGLPGWDPKWFEELDSPEGAGFRVVLPAGLPLELGPPVHWQQLARLYGNEATGLQVLDQFLARCLVLLPELATAIAANDAPNVLRTAHTLKGSARGVTANALAEAALQLEMLGRSGNLLGAADLYKALQDTYDAFIQWVREGHR